MAKDEEEKEKERKKHKLLQARAASSINEHRFCRGQLPNNRAKSGRHEAKPVVRNLPCLQNRQHATVPHPQTPPNTLHHEQNYHPQTAYPLILPFLSSPHLRPGNVAPKAQHHRAVVLALQPAPRTPLGPLQLLALPLRRREDRELLRPRRHVRHAAAVAGAEAGQLRLKDLVQPRLPRSCSCRDCCPVYPLVRGRWSRAR